MPKRNDKRDTAKAEYIKRRRSGEKVNLKDLAEKLGVTYGTVRNWKRIDQWDDAVERKRGGQPGNKNSRGKRNAKGNPGGGAPNGNTNAEKDGAYSTVHLERLSQEERDWLDQMPTGANENNIYELKLLRIQQRHIMERIAEYESCDPEKLFTASITDMRKPGKDKDGKQADGAVQKMVMDNKDSAFVRVTQLREALNKVSGRIISLTTQIRQQEEFEKRYALELERLDIAKMRATGEVDVDPEGTKIVAQYLDLSERRVRQLRDEGVLEEKAPGLYDLRSSVRRYINYLRGDEGGKADLNEERAKLTKEKRIAAETENKVRNGELYRKSDITVGMTTVVMNLRSRLLALPNKLAANIAKLDGDEGKIMDLLQSSLYEIMEEFSNYQVALQPPKDDEEDEQDGEETG